MVEPIDNVSIGGLEKGCSFGESELIIKMGDMEMTTIRRDSTQVRECFYQITLIGDSDCSIQENSYEEIDHENPNYQGYRSRLEGAGLW
jgi:hypothetical protein